MSTTNRWTRPERMTPLHAFNRADRIASEAVLLSACRCQHWASEVSRRRPYPHFEALLDAARAAWSEESVAGQLEAFRAHPKIGDVELLRARYADSGDRANAEQGQVLGATDEILEELAELNRVYHDRHGFIFIVYAKDKSASDMLELLKARLDRPTEEEMQTAAAEQMKITELRLTDLMREPS